MGLTGGQGICLQRGSDREVSCGMETEMEISCAKAWGVGTSARSLFSPSFTGRTLIGSALPGLIGAKRGGELHLFGHLDQSLGRSPRIVGFQLMGICRDEWGGGQAIRSA